jgi:hypothetical protein
MAAHPGGEALLVGFIAAVSPCTRAEFCTILRNISINQKILWWGLQFTFIFHIEPGIEHGCANQIRDSWAQFVAETFSQHQNS